MTAVYFTIAAIALIGAGALLWLDRRRSNDLRRERATWGIHHGFTYVASEAERGPLPDIRHELHRGAMDIDEHADILDIAHGRYGGLEVMVFDIDDHVTVATMRRSATSPVVIELRQEKVLAPAEADVELLGAVDRRVLFSTDLDIARRACDRRMVALATNAPDYIEILWNEGPWSAVSMPQTNDPVRLDTALESLRRFTDLLHVLPPQQHPAARPEPRDPSAPSGAARRGFVDPKTVAISRDTVGRGATEPAPSSVKQSRTQLNAHQPGSPQVDIAQATVNQPVAATLDGGTSDMSPPIPVRSDSVRADAAQPDSASADRVTNRPASARTNPLRAVPIRNDSAQPLDVETDNDIDEHTVVEREVPAWIRRGMQSSRRHTRDDNQS